MRNRRGGRVEEEWRKEWRKGGGGGLEEREREREIC